MKFKNNPDKAFQKTFGFALPPSSAIEKYLIKKGIIKLKIRIDEYDKEMIESQLLEHHAYSALTEESIIPNFKNTCSWWDMNTDEIVTSYEAMLPGKKVKTRLSYAFFTVNQQNEHYLYIVETFG